MLLVRIKLTKRVNSKESLLKIVKRWNIRLTPQYRGFRCADCQRYLHKAWHHNLDYGGFKTSVHFCNRCQRKYGLNSRIYKIFTCDECGRDMLKSYHVWTKRGKNLEETHFCKQCFLNSAKVH